MSGRTKRDVRTVATLAAVTVALMTGCGAVSMIENHGVSNPLTPEQSKAQVIDAGKEIVHTLGLQVIEPAFWRASCNDQGDPPFEGKMMIGYPMAASLQVSEEEIADMVGRLRNLGWTSPSDDVHTHGTALEKNGVTAIFYPQNVGESSRGLEITGACRDVTTSKQTAGNPEIVDLSTQ